MKKIISLVLLIALACTALVACGAPEPDYKDADALYEAIKADEDVDDKIVSFEVKDYYDNAPMNLGYCMEAGHGMMFCSKEDPKVKEGDTVTVKITSVQNMLGTYIISYEML